MRRWALRRRRQAKVTMREVRDGPALFVKRKSPAPARREMSTPSVPKYKHFSISAMHAWLFVLFKKIYENVKIIMIYLKYTPSGSISEVV
jgi:hypothetical protein